MPDDEAYRVVLATILGPTYAPLDIPVVDAAGVYALLLTKPLALPGLILPASGGFMSAWPATGPLNVTPHVAQAIALPTSALAHLVVTRSVRGADKLAGIVALRD